MLSRWLLREEQSGRERTSGVQFRFGITALMRWREDLTSHMVAMEKLLPPHVSTVHGYFLHRTVLFGTSGAVRDGAAEHNWG